MSTHRIDRADGLRRYPGSFCHLSSAIRGVCRTKSPLRPINNLEYDLVTGALVTALSKELSRRGCSQSGNQRLGPSRIKTRYGDLPRGHKEVRSSLSTSCRDTEYQKRG